MSGATMNLMMPGMSLGMVPVAGCVFTQGDAALDAELGTNYGERQVEVDSFVMQETPLTIGQMNVYRKSEPRRYGVIGVDPEDGVRYLLARGRTSNETSMDELPLFADKPVEVANLVKLGGGRPIEIIPPIDWLNDLAEPFRRPSHPAVRLSVFDTLGIATYLNQQAVAFRARFGLGVFRLPTRAEQERVMKGPNAKDPKQAFKYGTHDGQISPDRARYSLNSYNTTGPVDEFAGIVFLGGIIYGLAGNVCEWCSDRWAASYDKSPDEKPIKNPKGPKTGDFNAIGGGSYRSSVQMDLRSAYVNGIDPYIRDEAIGARLVAAVLPQDPK